MEATALCEYCHSVQITAVTTVHCFRAHAELDILKRPSETFQSDIFSEMVCDRHAVGELSTHMENM